MNLKPLGDRVIVRQAEAESQTASGIILADTAQEKPTQGTVVAVGDGKFDDKGERVPIEVKAGDRVVYGKYSGQDYKLGDDELKILRADDIIAIVEG